MRQSPPRKPRLPQLVIHGRCEGQQEEMYFCYLQKLINSVSTRKRDVHFNIKSAGGFNPLHVVEDASRMSITSAHSDRPYHVAIFDHDFKAEFDPALDLCKERTITSAYSCVCFDLWMLLHKRHCLSFVATTHGYDKWIWEEYTLPAGSDIKKADVIETMLQQIQLPDVRRAIAEAKKICANNRDTNRQVHTTLRNIHYYDNPDLNLHLLIEKVLNLSGV